MAATARKFEIAYMLCKEKMALIKMAVIYELEKRHGVELGTGYKNKKACSMLMDYILQELYNMAVVNSLTKAKFFSLQLDGSTDSGYIEDKLFFVVFCDLFSGGWCHPHT